MLEKYCETFDSSKKLDNYCLLQWNERKEEERRKTENERNGERKRDE